MIVSQSRSRHKNKDKPTSQERGRRKEMKVSKNKLRRIIAEELSGQSKNDNRFIRESIREIIIQEELQLEFLDKFKGAFSKIASGEFSKI